MKKLVVYYSLEGNTKLIANEIAKTVGADVLELKPKKDVSPKGLMKFFQGGRQVMQKEEPALEPFAKRPEDCDEIFIGSPVWAWTYAPALKTFFSETHLKDKKIALFCCSGGGKGKTLDNMKERLTGNDIIGETDFIVPLQRNTEENVEKAKKWAKGIVKE